MSDDNLSFGNLSDFLSNCDTIGHRLAEFLQKKTGGAVARPQRIFQNFEQERLSLDVRVEKRVPLPDNSIQEIQETEDQQGNPTLEQQRRTNQRETALEIPKRQSKLMEQSEEQHKHTTEGTAKAVQNVPGDTNALNPSTSIPFKFASPVKRASIHRSGGASADRLRRYSLKRLSQQCMGRRALIKDFEDTTTDVTNFSPPLFSTPMEQPPSNELQFEQENRRRDEITPPSSPLPLPSTPAKQGSEHHTQHNCTTDNGNIPDPHTRRCSTEIRHSPQKLLASPKVAKVLKRLYGITPIIRTNLSKNLSQTQRDETIGNKTPTRNSNINATLPESQYSQHVVIPETQDKDTQELLKSFKNSKTPMVLIPIHQTVNCCHSSPANNGTKTIIGNQTFDIPQNAAAKDNESVCITKDHVDQRANKTRITEKSEAKENKKNRKQRKLVEPETDIQISNIITEDEDEDVNVERHSCDSSSVPLNLASSKETEVRKRCMRKRSLRGRGKKNDQSQLLSTETETEIGPPRAHALNLRRYSRSERTSRHHLPLNKAPNTPINGEKFAVEIKKQLMRMTNYEILDLRKRNSLNKIFPISGRKDVSKKSAIVNRQQLEEDIATEILKRQLQNDDMKTEFVFDVEPLTTDIEPDVFKQTEPDVFKQSEPDVFKQTEPDVFKQTEPDVFKQTEPDVFKQSEPDVFKQTEPDVFKQTEPDVFKQTEPDVFKQTEADVFKPSEPDVLKQTEPDVLTQNEPDVLTQNEPDPDHLVATITPSPPVFEVQSQVVSDTGNMPANDHLCGGDNGMFKELPSPPSEFQDIRATAKPPAHRSPLLPSNETQLRSDDESSLIDERSCDRVSFLPTNTENKQLNAPKRKVAVPEVMQNYINASKVVKKTKKSNPSKRSLYTKGQSDSEFDDTLIGREQADAPIFKKPKLPAPKTKPVGRPKGSSKRLPPPKSRPDKNNRSRSPSPHSSISRTQTPANNSESNDTGTEANESSTLRRSKRGHVPLKNYWSFSSSDPTPLFQVMFAKQMMKNLKISQMLAEKKKKTEKENKIAQKKIKASSESTLQDNQSIPIASSTAYSNIVAEGSALRSKKKTDRAQKKGTPYSASCNRHLSIIDEPPAELEAEMDRVHTGGDEPVRTSPSHIQHSNKDTNRKTPAEKPLEKKKSSARSRLALTPLNKNHNTQDVKLSQKNTIKESANQILSPVFEHKTKKMKRKKQLKENKGVETSRIAIAPTPEDMLYNDSQSQKPFKQNSAIEHSRVDLMPAPVEELNSVFDELKRASVYVCEEGIEPLPTSAQSDTSSETGGSLKRLRVRVQRVKFANTVTEDRTQQSETVNSRSQTVGEKSTQSSSQELLSWLKGISDMHTLNENNRIFQDMHCSAAGNLSFIDLEGIDYAFYDTDDKASVGYLRFRPGQCKPAKRAKQYHLHFIVLSGTFSITTNNDCGTFIQGDLVAINKQVRYRIENTSDDIGLLLVMKK